MHPPYMALFGHGEETQAAGIAHLVVWMIGSTVTGASCPSGMDVVAEGNEVRILPTGEVLRELMMARRPPLSRMTSRRESRASAMCISRPFAGEDLHRGITGVDFADNTRPFRAEARSVEQKHMRIETLPRISKSLGSAIPPLAAEPLQLLGMALCRFGAPAQQNHASLLAFWPTPLRAASD